MVYGSSREFLFSLSDASSYNEVHVSHTYDDIGYKTDETDYDQVYIPFSLTGLTAGAKYTYYIAGKVTFGTGTIYHGAKSDGSAYSPPIIVKAIALPSTITTGK